MVIFHSYVKLPEGIWVVVSTHLKNIGQLSQLGLFFLMFLENKKMFETTNQYIVYSNIWQDKQVEHSKGYGHVRTFKKSLSDFLDFS